MDSMNDRRDAFESKFAHDETLRFKAFARRNKLLGLWAADVMGYDDDAADSYANGILQAGVNDPARAVANVEADFAVRGIDGTSVASKAEELLAIATEQVTKG